MIGYGQFVRASEFSDWMQSWNRSLWSRHGNIRRPLSLIFKSLVSSLSALSNPIQPDLFIYLFVILRCSAKFSRDRKTKIAYCILHCHSIIGSRENFEGNLIFIEILFLIGKTKNYDSSTQFFFFFVRISQHSMFS